MLIVAGLSLKNLEPRVWDPESPLHVPSLGAVMVSYGEFHQMPARRKAAMNRGLREFLGVPESVKIYLDNGAFHFGSRESDAPVDEYEEFVDKAKPDWKPIPQDYIPFPNMTNEKRLECFTKTMMVNLKYQHNGYVPVVHIGSHLEKYTASLLADHGLAGKPEIALGAIVPNLLRKPKALPYGKVLLGLKHVREKFQNKSIHVFGVGGTATLHLAALLNFDSVDSSGWRNRAARGIVQLQGSGERLVAGLGNWRGRAPAVDEWKLLERCKCPACRAHGTVGLKADRLHGFRCRATHNLWVLLEENRWLSRHIGAGTYARNYRRRVDNSVYKPIIRDLLELLRQDRSSLADVGSVRLSVGGRSATALRPADIEPAPREGGT